LSNPPTLDGILEIWMETPLKLARWSKSPRGSLQICSCCRKHRWCLV